REHQMMNERGAVYCVLAVIARVVVTAPQINRTRVHKRVKTGCDILQLWRCVTWVVFVIGTFFCQRTVYRTEFCRHIRHFYQRSVTWFVNKPRERYRIVRPATLMINSKRIGARKRADYTLVDKKRKRCPQSGN